MKMPGFIDLQVNGYKGIDFSSENLSAEDCAKACRDLLNHGTAAFFPTLITSDTATYRRNLPILADIMNQEAFKGRVLGLHLEGPFISKQPGAVGAHNPKWVKRPSLKYFEKLQKWARGNIRLVTLAAEVPGAVELTKELVRQHVVVFLGHQMASYEDMARLADAGARGLTHLGNGMPNQVHRHHNQLLDGLAEDRLWACLITDGHHLPGHIVKMMIKAKTADKIIVTSDASPLAGLRPGRYETLGNIAVLEKNGLLHNPHKECLVGSSFTMLECMNYLASLKILQEEELFKAGYYNPLKLTGFDARDIREGKGVRLNVRTNQFEIL